MSISALDLLVKIGVKDEATSAIGKLGEGVRGFAKIGAAAFAAGGAAVGGFAASAVSAGMQFDTAMSNVAATMGTTVDNIQELRDFAQEMGSTTAFSATQAADALNYMALAGYDADTSMAMLPQVLNLAAAGEIDLAYASDMVTDSQSALGLSVEETSVMIDQMARTSSTTNTSVQQLGEALLTIGGTAQSASGGTAELSAVLGAMADNGIKGSEAGTHLRNIMLALGNVTEQTGVEVYDANGNLRNMEDIFMDLNGAMSDLTDQERTLMLGSIFNKTDLAAVNALLGTDAERWEEINAAIGDCAGAAEAMAETKLDNLQGQITLFKSALEGAQIAISDELAPTLSDFVSIGSEGLSNMTKAFKEGGLEGLVTAFQETLQKILSKIGEVAPQAAEAITQVIAAVIQALIGSAPQIIDAAFQTFITMADAILDVYPTAIDTLTEVIDSIAANFDTYVPLILDTAIKLFMSVAEAIPKILPSVVNALLSLVSSIVSTIISRRGDILDAGINLIKGLVSGIGQSAHLVIEKIKEICSGALDAVKSFFGIHSPSRVMAKMGTYIGEGLANGIESTKGLIDDAWQDAVAGITDVTASADITSSGTPSQYSNGIIIQNMTVRADDAKTADEFVAMLRQASLAYA